MLKVMKGSSRPKTSKEDRIGRIRLTGRGRGVSQPGGGTKKCVKTGGNPIIGVLPICKGNVVRS